MSMAYYYDIIEIKVGWTNVVGMIVEHVWSSYPAIVRVKVHTYKSGFQIKWHH